jgi:hypothetical protein
MILYILIGLSLILLYMPQSTKNAIVVAITEEDIEKIKQGETVRDNKENIAIYQRGTDEKQNVQTDYFIIRMSETALNRVNQGETITYGIRKLGNVNQELFVRKGKVSERVGTDKTTKEQLVDDGMSEDEAERYS